MANFSTMFVAALAVVVVVAMRAEAAPQQHRSKVITLVRGGQQQQLLLDAHKDGAVRTAIPSAPTFDDDDDAKDKKKLVQVVRTAKHPDDESELFRKQAESAKYAFQTSIDDGIGGLTNTRTETRDGLKVQGMYSYSDGFYKRTIEYEADDKGYRVVKELVEPIGDGPVVDLGGEAVVRSSLGSDYKITIDDYQKLIEKRQKSEQQ